MSAILSLLLGSGFRAIWGEVGAFIKNKQEHKQELEFLRVQDEIDAAKHARLQESIKTQHEMGVEVVRVQADAALMLQDSKTFDNAATAAIAVKSGVKWVDGWNAAIRPAAATIALGLWLFALLNAGFVMSDFDKELVCAILGFFFANRVLASRGR